MGMRPAIELSYLTKNEQKKIYRQIEMFECTPSHEQAIRIRRLSEKRLLDEDIIENIMREQKPNQSEKVHILYDQIRQYIPKNIPFEETAEYIKLALRYYQETHLN